MSWWIILLILVIAVLVLAAFNPFSSVMALLDLGEFIGQLFSRKPKERREAILTALAGLGCCIAAMAVIAIILWLT